MTHVTATSDIRFAEIDGEALHLNLYRPDTEGVVPVVLYLHGGAWQFGDRAADAEKRLKPLAAHGIAVVSADYRLAPASVFPAQIHDVKAAVRWIRANADGYGLLADRVGVWGASAGALLGSLSALTPGDEELEGTVGEDLDQSSAIQAVVHWFGPADFVSAGTRSPFEAAVLPPSMERVLFGPGSEEATAATARAASPLHRELADAPAFLIAHGDRDRMLPVGHNEAFHGALSRAGARSTFMSLGGAGHEDPVFDGAANLGMTAAFLLAELAPAPSGDPSGEAHELLTAG